MDALLDAGQNPNSLFQGRTPLEIAAGAICLTDINHIKCCQLLLAAAARTGEISGKYTLNEILREKYSQFVYLGPYGGEPIYPQASIDAFIALYTLLMVT